MLRQRIYYEDTDFGGGVYHARYLHFFERARTDYLRCLGIHQGAMVEGDEGMVFVVRKMTIEFKRPARMDDIVTIETRPSELSGARMTLAQTMKKADIVLATAEVNVAVIGLNGRPRRLPMDLKAAFEAVLPSAC